MSKINLESFKGRGSAADGAVKQWKDPISGRVPKPTDGPAAPAKPSSISDQVGKASKRVVDSSSDT